MLKMYIGFTYFKFDRDFKAPDEGGVVMNRSCTDILCCIIFLVFIVGMFGAGIYGYTNGDPVALLTAWDSDGKQ